MAITTINYVCVILLISVEKLGGNKIDAAFDSGEGSNSSSRSDNVRHFSTSNSASDNISTTNNDSRQHLDGPDENATIGLMTSNGQILEEVLEGISTLTSYLFPDEFPVAFINMLFHAEERYKSWPDLVIKFIKLERLLLIWIILWLLLSIIVPCCFLVRNCRSRNDMERLRESVSNSSFDLKKDACKWKASIVFLHVLLAMVLLTLFPILMSNEKLSRSINETPDYLDGFFDDIERFIENSYAQINFLTTTKLESTLDKVSDYLENSERHLGLKAMRNFVEVSKLNDTLAKCKLLSEHARNVSDKIDSFDGARKLSENSRKTLSDNLREVWSNMVDFRRRCLARDQVLCDSLIAAPISVNAAVTDLNEDAKLRRLRELMRGDVFAKIADKMTRNFHRIPQLIAEQTNRQRIDIRESLNRERGKLYKSLRRLETLSTSLNGLTRSAAEEIKFAVTSTIAWERWRYLAVFAAASLVFLTWSIYVCGATFGCGRTAKNSRTLLIGLLLSWLAGLVVCSLASLTILIGANGNSLICSTLQERRHDALTYLLDDGGLFYKNGGLLRSILEGDESISVREVIRKCRYGQTVYTTFKLSGKFDVDNLLNHENWQGFDGKLRNVRLEPILYRVLTDDVYRDLEAVRAASAVDFAKYRESYGKFVSMTSHDLVAFATQVECVASKLYDVDAANALNKVYAKVRKVLNNEYEALAKNRERVFYEIISLEISYGPFKYGLDEVYNRFNAIKMDLFRDETAILDKTRNDYVGDIVSELRNYFNYVRRNLMRNNPKCAPLSNRFDEASDFFCGTIVDYLNFLAVSLYLTLTILLVIAPIIGNIRRYYQKIREDDLLSITHRKYSDDDVINDEGHWASIPTTARSPESVVRSPTTIADVSSVDDTSNGSPIVRIPRPPPPRRQDTLEIIEESSSWK